MSAAALSEREVGLLREVAAVLIPGDGEAPPALEVPEFDELLERAAVALGPDLPGLHEAIEGLPDGIDGATLKSYYENDGARFGLIGTAVSGAYFMAPAALSAIGYPTGPRSAPPFDLAAEELASGILEPVIERGFDG
jgi:hypothetical protein